MNNSIALVYRNIGLSLVVAGGIMLLVGWGYWSALPILVGTAFFTSQFIIEAISRLLQSISPDVHADWQGEILHAEGGKFNVRYSLDANNQPRFVAGDVCRAIGVKSPNKSALKWGGAALLMRGDHACFSEAAVQAFLTPLAINNHAANLLLNKLRNEVFRKLDTQREHERNASRESVI